MGQLRRCRRKPSRKRNASELAGILQGGWRKLARRQFAAARLLRFIQGHGACGSGSSGHGRAPGIGANFSREHNKSNESKEHAELEEKHRPKRYECKAESSMEHFLQELLW